MPFFPNYFKPTSLKAKLYKATWTPDLTNDEFRDDIDSHASTGTNVDVKTVTQSFTYSNSPAHVSDDFTDITWSTLTTSDAKYVVFYMDSGAASTDKLVAYVDLISLGFTGSITADTLTLQFNTNGFFRINL